MEETLMRLVYVYNILGAGVVGVVVLLAPRIAAGRIFAGAVTLDASTSILGSIWLAVGVVSVLGLVFPAEMSAVFLVQLVYKSVWLLGVALPAIVTGKGRSIPPVMAILFAVWVVVLPFVTPFGYLTGS